MSIGRFEEEKRRRWQMLTDCERNWNAERPEFKANTDNFRKHSQEIQKLKAEYDQACRALAQAPRPGGNKLSKDPESRDALNRFFAQDD